MSQGNDIRNYDFSQDVEMTEYQHSDSEAFTASPFVAGPPTLTKSGGKHPSKICLGGHNTTADALRILRTPLPSHVSAKQILKNYPERLHYNNLLKAALYYNNNSIADHLVNGTGTARVIQRLKTAIKWLASEFNIDDQALWTAFNRERTLKGVHRSTKKDSFDESVLAANADKTNDVIAWIKRGGPYHNASLPDHDSQPSSPNTTSSPAPRKIPMRHIPRIYSCAHPGCLEKFPRMPMLNAHIRSNQKHWRIVEGCLIPNAF